MNRRLTERAASANRKTARHQTTTGSEARRRNESGALDGWLRIARAALADGAKPRTEVLWLNPALAARRPSPGLLEAAA